MSGRTILRALFLLVFVVTLTVIPGRTAKALDADDNRVLTNGVTLAGTISPLSDVDFYAFAGIGGRKIILTMNSTSSVDPYLQLYDTNNTTLLKFDDDSGPGLNSMIVFYLPHNGTYRVRARSFGAGSSGGYNIRLSMSATDPDDGRTLYNLVPMAGAIEPNSDLDTYYFNSSAGKHINLSMWRTGGSTVDSYLILYDTNFTTMLIWDDDGGTCCFNAFISNYVLPHTGRYKVVAKSWSGGSHGPYNIKLTVLP